MANSFIYREIQSFSNCLSQLHLISCLLDLSARPLLFALGLYPLNLVAAITSFCCCNNSHLQSQQPFVVLSLEYYLASYFYLSGC